MIIPIRLALSVFVVCAFCDPRSAEAQVGPMTVTRSPEGAITVRAVRIPEPIRLDGRLDERVYSEVQPFSEFIQQEPHEGAPATEKTEAWIFFDDRNIYISARCLDSQPEREIANEMRRDSNNIIQNESFTIIFDSFHDKRNGVFFQTNALGALRDASSTDERSQNTDWNAVWDVRTHRSNAGWTVEFVIPFRSLRYGPGREQTWGINLRRIIGWKSEWVYLSPPPAYLGMPGILAVSKAATLVGLEVPATRPALELKPYFNLGMRTDLAAREPFRNRADKHIGGDLKYGLTKSLTLDLTYNTDFAQVEDDTQQVNLTRFNLQFPERREFFLEGQGVFTFGGGGFGGGGSSNNTPVLFFSRRIGLNNGRPVPIAGGGRLNGRVGPYSVGLLNIQSKEDEASSSKGTNFSVLRLKRDVLRRSNIGLLYTRRMETGEGGVGPGQTFGVDGLYSLSTSLNVNGYFAATTGNTHESRRKNRSHHLAFDYSADRYGFQAQHLAVGTNFNPQVGFLRRTDFKRSFAQARFSPRPSRDHWKSIRRFVYQTNIEYIENNAGRIDFREQEAQFLIEQVNGDQLNVDFTRDYEFIPREFEISQKIFVPVGGYTFNNLLTSYTLGQRRFLSGSVSFQQGQLYGGTKRSIGLSGGRMELSSQLALEPSVSINWVRLPFGDFTQSVITERTTYTISPRMFVSALTQYASGSRAFSVNARLRWEYRPLSELFVVYSDGRDTTAVGFPRLVNRALIIKINKLFRV